MIVIIDYGIGNLGSIQNMFKKVGCNDVVISNDPSEIHAADKLLLPGVGSFDHGMRKINESGLLATLNHEVLELKKPVLGICLGMQLLTKGSDEGELPGLGWIDAETLKFNFGENKYNLKIPHMGWNEITVSKDHPLTHTLLEHSRFYFVHSYYVKCQAKEQELLSTHYGFDFTCGIQQDNIMGVQFHPEKSHTFGMQLFKNFVEM
jgi:imidazole glycerol-phosphate synthase subunit HisH